MSESSELLRRVFDFTLALERDAAETVEEFDWGRLIYNPATAAMWSGNYLEVHSAELDAGALAALADEVQGQLAGIGHRTVMPADPHHGERLVEGFQALDDWEVVRSLYMVLGREPDREADAAREVPMEAVEAVRRALADDDPDFTPESAEQRLIRDARLREAGNGRWFAAPPEGPPGAACVLFERDGIGQVENVGTAPKMRGRGLASAVVTAASRASLDAGHELTFLEADAEDWPWLLYEKLGFDRVGEACWFLRKPPQLRAESSP